MVHPTCNDKYISSWEYHQCQIHTIHQSDTEYTRTSITHNSTTQTTNTKMASLGGTYSAPSYPMMSYNILPPIAQQKNHSSIMILYTRTKTVDMYKDPTVQPQNERRSHKSLSVYCTPSPECNIKDLITGNCKRGAQSIRVDCIMELCDQKKFPSLLPHS